MNHRSPQLCACVPVGEALTDSAFFAAETAWRTGLNSASGSEKLTSTVSSTFNVVSTVWPLT
jgi:hypothetical protein